MVLVRRPVKVRVVDIVESIRSKLAPRFTFIRSLMIGLEIWAYKSAIKVSQPLSVGFPLVTFPRSGAMLRYLSNFHIDGMTPERKLA